MTNYTYTNQKQIRSAFVDLAKECDIDIKLTRGSNPITQNKQNATTRSIFVDFVDNLQKNGDISEALAGRVTL